MKPESGVYLFLCIRKLNIDDRVFWSRLLNEYATAVAPGASFWRAGFVRSVSCGETNDVKKRLRQEVMLCSGKYVFVVGDARPVIWLSFESF